MKNLPKLFKQTSTGAIQEWSISVKGNEIHTIYGQVGGKLQSTVDIIRVGKNVGRSNETTPEEQALSEAQSKWEKQVKKGYVEDLNRASQGDTDHEGGINPMLAHKFSEQGHKIKYSAYVQPKLDGHRCIAIIEDGKCTLWSRTRKPINSVPHIVKELESVYKDGTHIVDGELYNHSYKNNFEAITSLIRQEEPHSNHTEVQFHVYDKAMPGGFADRIKTLTNELHTHEKAVASLKYIIPVQTLTANDEEELMDAFENFLSIGYEGAMVRNVDGEYLNKRSYDLQKIKEFEDAEFKIVGVEEGRGKLMGHAAKFICKMPSGEEFRAKLKGNTSKLKEFFEDHSLWKDKMVTVKYQGITKYGLPRFPVAERLREDV